MKLADVASHFQDGPHNIGVILGDASNGLIDIDLDHPLAIELADEFLPATPAVFGRASMPRSHRLYYVTSPLPPAKFSSNREGTLFEIRSTGQQTVFPGSVHVEGESIEWEDETAEPATVDPSQLWDCCQQLFKAAKLARV